MIVLLLFCPYCELEAEETEFSPGGQAHIKRESVGSSDITFEKYLFFKKNRSRSVCNKEALYIFSM